MLLSLAFAQLCDLELLCSDADADVASLAHQERASLQHTIRENEEQLLLMLLPEEEDAERAAVLEVGASSCLVLLLF